MKIINAEKAPKALGPYSQGIEANGFIFLSGQIAIDPKKGMLVGNTIEEQAERILLNIQAILDELGLNFQNIVKATCFLVDMADFASFNEIYAKFMGEHKPARSCVAVRELPKNALCEVEVIVAR